MANNIYNMPSVPLRKIFQYLSASDVFNLGLCSKALNMRVLEECFHPLSCQLQCIKTTVKYHFKEASEYDYVENFKHVHKCRNSECVCQVFIQQQRCFVIDPFLCVSYDKYILNLISIWAVI